MTDMDEAPEVEVSDGPIASAIADAIDSGECDWDHNHSCQEHMDFYVPQGVKCRNERLKDALAAVRAGAPTWGQVVRALAEAERGPLTDEEYREVETTLPSHHGRVAEAMFALFSGERDEAKRPATPFEADCWRCANEASARLKATDPARAMGFRMYLCPECGDKRCARAVNHRNACDAEERAREGSA